MHATEEDLQAIAQIEESEAGGQEDDDDDDLLEPQAPLSPCRPAVVQAIVQRSAGRKRTAHNAKNKDPGEGWRITRFVRK